MNLMTIVYLTAKAMQLLNKLLELINNWLMAFFFLSQQFSTKTFSVMS